MKLNISITNNGGKDSFPPPPPFDREITPDLVVDIRYSNGQLHISQLGHPGETIDLLIDDDVTLTFKS